MTLRVGLVGCGNISDIYLINGALFRDFAFTACADVNPEASRRQAERFALPARSVKDLLASEDVDIILNLTIPEAHAEVSLAAIAAGKHVYTEKPLATTIADGKKIVEAARVAGLRVGAAPDTVFGPGIQEARRIVDDGEIGRPLSGLAAILSHGMEHWHPNPGFFFRPGGGPVFDMGPYYLSALVNLLGPVASVQAFGQIGFAERIVTTPGSAMQGLRIRVETLTSVQALLEFASGAQVTFLASWDVWSHTVPTIELYGQTGSLRAPDPNWFGGVVHIAERRADWVAVEAKRRGFGAVNWPPNSPQHANYRGLGLADMARAIKDNRPHRANGDVGLHVLAVMVGVLEAATERRRVVIDQDCARPAFLGESEALALLK